MNKQPSGPKLGLIINPIAGMGGRVGLKGTDGKATLAEALELGAKRVASNRAEETLRLINQSNIQGLATYGDPMGELEAKRSGFQPILVGRPSHTETTAADTMAAARGIAQLGAELLLFAGGDGTAADICRAIDGEIPVLGIPSGVKMYSACFSINPAAAARIASSHLTRSLPVEDREVLDVDEESYRRGQLQVKITGYLRCPYEPTLSQDSKKPTTMDDDMKSNQAAIARYVVEQMDSETTYILGPGTTVRAIAEQLNVPKALLGVDVVRRGSLLATDANEAQILRELEHSVKAVIIVSPLGNQGHIFGRGNQQLSPAVIRKVGLENLIVVAARRKLARLCQLYVDTGDRDLDAKLRGYHRVVVDYMMEHVARVV